MKNRIFLILSLLICGAFFSIQISYSGNSYDTIFKLVFAFLQNKSILADFSIKNPLIHIVVFLLINIYLIIFSLKNKYYLIIISTVLLFTIWVDILIYFGALFSKGQFFYSSIPFLIFLIINIWLAIFFINKNKSDGDPL
ncbi:MAG: hypothetical protein BGO86_05035 [Chryseobacterium sp. 36-9]|nr:MAG: hypothetical protein BGO86_05035 [Chryseobacterium sp. 36-9]